MHNVMNLHVRSYVDGMTSCIHTSDPVSDSGSEYGPWGGGGPLGGCVPWLWADSASNEWWGGRADSHMSISLTTMCSSAVMSL